MPATFAGVLKHEALSEQIIVCLEKGIDVVPLIKHAVGMNRCVVDNCLREMEAKGQVHHVRGRNPKGGYINRWILGPSEDPEVISEIDLPNIILTPATAVYPAVGIRDPLVAALFCAPGLKLQAPKQSAPRCTACGMEQGAGHLRNCIVQLVAA